MPCGCLCELMERSDVSYKVSPHTAGTCFGLQEGHGVSSGRFVSDDALMRSGSQQTPALSKDMTPEMTGHTTVGSSPPHLCLQGLFKPQDFWRRTRCQLVTFFSEGIWKHWCIANVSVTSVREDGDHDTLLDIHVSQYLLKIFASWGSWATQ